MTDPTLQTNRDGTTGRPEFTEDQYRAWLEDMRPHLELGCSLYRATMKAAIEPHYAVILRKYQVKDWFSQKIDAYRSLPGENVNEALVRLSNKALDRVKRDEFVNKEEFDVLKLMAEKHRTAQPFFVNRTETAESKKEDVGKVLDVLDGEITDYDDVANKAAQQLGSETPGQVVAPNSPVQDPQQAGPAGDVQAKPDSAATPEPTP